ncbi:hypothetical protein GCM10009798_41070 [Nocardioides panacihumi]|uniref:Uncharacterized protein n=1 Tax=Nocardioides panacihumi TaxID=400774 RepID=A0ABP5D7Z4_9ACTN
MNSNHDSDEGTINIRLRQILLELARREDEIAHMEAAAVPYWDSPPLSVVGHRAAADSLRFEADRFLRAS